VEKNTYIYMHVKQAQRISCANITYSFIQKPYILHTHRLYTHYIFASLIIQPIELD